jgi:undecaprenyl-diphosphatase
VSSYLISLLLGIIEGLTEFLPVSSTAHLRIAESMLGINLTDGYWKMYSIVIQLGAILCLPIFFRRKLLTMVRTFPKGESGDQTVLTHPLTLTFVAFVVTAIPAFLLHKKIGENLESLTVMGIALVAGGVIMAAVDFAFAQRAKVDRVETMGFGRAVWIGAAQILSAVFPGTSRSMSTIAAGQVVEMSRASALEFSFLLCIPTMAAATGYDFLKTVVLRKGGPGETLPPIDMSTERWIILAIGFVVSFFVAWAVVAWFTAWVRRRGFTIFAVYRIIVGIFVLAVLRAR